MYIRKSIRSYKGKTYTNYVLVESVVTPNGPRQKTICSLGDLSPRPREGWLELALKIEDALVGQDNLVGSDDSEVAEIVGRVRARRTKEGCAQAEPSASLPRTRGGALIKVDPSRVTTEQHREAGPVHVGGPVAGLVGIDGGVVSGVTNLESPGVRAPSRRPRHEEGYHDARAFAFDDRD